MITVPELRAELRPATNEDDTLAGIREQVVAMWEHETCALWDAREGHVMTLEVHRSARTVDLPAMGVSEIDKVETRSALIDDEWVELDESDYMRVGARGLRRLGGEWGEGTLVRVTADVGMAQAPADIRKALLVQARFLRERLRDGMVAARSQAFEQGSTNYETADLHPLFLRAAMRHRREMH